MHHHPALSLPLLLLMLLALVAAGCGGGDNGSEADTAKLLSDTFGKEKPVKSGKLALAVDVNDTGGVGGLPSPLRIDLSGPFQSGAGKTPPKFAFDLGLKTADGNVTIGAISTGDKSWLKLAERAFTLPDDAFEGLTGKGGKDAPAPVDLSTFGVDPRKWLSDVENLGEEDLRGDRVIHLRADVDSEPLVADLDKLLGRAGGVGGSGAVPEGISEAQRQELIDAITGAQVDIWTGAKDHKLRRILVDVKLDAPEEKTGTIKLDLAVSQINREQAIGPPADPRPISELNAALASLAARSEQDSQDGGGSAQLPENASDYDRCLAGAGEDIEAAQRCADLVGG